MNKMEFMERLEYLLSDIPEEDKVDAIAYYRDYLEEAGDHADTAMEEFGSPERIAAIIRSDLAGGMEEGGAFTERGYEDERFRDPNFAVAKRYDLPQEREDKEQWTSAGQAVGEENGQKDQQKKPPRTSKTLKVVLWIILIIVASPILLGAGGAAMGLAAGMLGLLVGAVALLAAVTLALFLGGFALCALGIISMITWIPGGLLVFGAGVVVMGIGILSLLVSILFYGKFMPWLVRCIIEGISRLVHGGRKVR